MTADEVRKLMPSNKIKTAVDKLLKAIEKRARENNNTLRTSWDYSDDEWLWVTAGYSRNNDWKLAEKMLTDLGYKVEFYYDCGQFVNMYTLISW